MSGTIQVGCRLPHGIVLELPPVVGGGTIALRGANRERIIGSGYGITEVDANKWAQFTTLNADFAPLKVGAIFDADDRPSLESVAAEVAKETTGFEALPQEGNGIKVDKDTADE